MAPEGSVHSLIIVSRDVTWVNAAAKVVRGNVSYLLVKPDQVKL